jgi:rubredoxin
VAIPLASESAPAALIDGDQTLSVELSESDPELVALVRAAEGSEVAAGGKGKRAEYRCAACGYGIVVDGQPPRCPMCSEPGWEHVEWAAFLPAARVPFGTRSRRRRLHAASFANGRGADQLFSPGPSRSSARKMTPKEQLAQLASARTKSGLGLSREPERVPA